MQMRNLLVTGAGAAALLVALAAAGTPKALTTTMPGQWEISGQPLSPKPVTMCVADLASLAQLEHRRSRCTRVVIRDTPSLAEIHYTCAGGGFGRSTMKLITPRSLRIETQGIAGSAPFNYVFQARRIGDCPQTAAH